MSLEPTYYTEEEGGKYLPWPEGHDIHGYDMVVGNGNLNFALSSKRTIKIHSLHWGPIGSFRVEWDVVNGWRTALNRPPENDVSKQTAAGPILAEAARLVGGDRQRTHGDKLQNHENIVRLWNAYILNKKNYTIGMPLSPLDVALMMALVKIARTQLGSHNPDNYVDLAGYAAVAGEIAERTR